MSLVRLDKIQAAYNGNLESVVHNADMANGSVVMLGGLVAGERELRQVVVPTVASSGTEELLLVAAPEVNYSPLEKDEDFLNKANKAARAYHLSVGDIFTVTDDMLAGVSVVGEYIVPADGLKLGVSATVPTTPAPRFLGKVLEKTTLGYEGAAATVIQVVKA